ncbi:MAG: DUF2752 domain-containing protein [Verrucomicrobiales bacterium]
MRRTRRVGTEQPEGLGRGVRSPRLLAASFLVLALGALAFTLKQLGPAQMPWTCILHEVTGLHCPGCGMTRATAAAMDGQLGDAFRFNPLGVVLLPIAAVLFLPVAKAWICGRPLKRPVWFGRRSAWTLLVVVISFTVARNLPFSVFECLVPPSP